MIPLVIWSGSEAHRSYTRNARPAISGRAVIDTFKHELLRAHAHSLRVLSTSRLRKVKAPVRVKARGTRTRKPLCSSVRDLDTMRARVHQSYAFQLHLRVLFVLTVPIKYLVAEEKGTHLQRGIKYLLEGISRNKD